MAPTPPVIVTTDLDGPTPNNEQQQHQLEQQQSATASSASPSFAQQHQRQVSDPSHLSPLAAQGPGFVPPAGATVVTPPSPTLTNNSYNSSPTEPTSAAGLAPIGEKSSVRQHERSNSVGTWTSTATSEKPFSPPTQIAAPEQPEEELDEKDGKKKKKKSKKNKEEVLVSHLDPDLDKTDVTPFKENPSRLAMLVDPKSLEDLQKIGGIEGVLDGLGVDGTRGLNTSGDGGAPRSGADMPGGNGPQWNATIEDRQRAYGKNDLPVRPAKTLLQLMWAAFKDKVLVSDRVFFFPLLPRADCAGPSYDCCSHLSRPWSLPGLWRKARTHLYR